MTTNNTDAVLSPEFKLINLEDRTHEIDTFMTFRKIGTKIYIRLMDRCGNVVRREWIPKEQAREFWRFCTSKGWKQI